MLFASNLQHCATTGSSRPLKSSAVKAVVFLKIRYQYDRLAEAGESELISNYCQHLKRQLPALIASYRESIAWTNFATQESMVLVWESGALSKHP